LIIYVLLSPAANLKAFSLGAGLLRIAGRALIQNGVLHNAPQQPSQDIAPGDDLPGLAPEQDDVMIRLFVTLGNLQLEFELADGKKGQVKA
jgi:hypothetical protein